MTKGNRKVNNDFVIDSFVMAIMPEQYGSKLYTRILKLDGEDMAPYSPIEIIKKSCTFYASSYDGRKAGTKELIGITHKAPIVIDPIQSIYFFPTASPKQRHCIWISLNHVLTFTNSGQIKTEVIFKNKNTIKIPMSSSSFEKQLLRTALLRTKIDPRFIQTEMQRQYLYQNFELGFGAMERSHFYEIFPGESIERSPFPSQRFNR